MTATFSSLLVGYGDQQVRLKTRSSAVFAAGAPYFRSEKTDAPTAFDVMPNGTGGTGVDIAWIDILNSDIGDDEADFEALTLLARSDSFLVGSHAGGAGQHRRLLLGGTQVAIQSFANGDGSPAQYALFRDLGAYFGPDGAPFAWLTPVDARFGKNYAFRWTGGATATSGAIDTGIDRKASGVVEVNNGEKGSYAGSALTTGAQTVAQLPSPATAGAGARAFVTDAISAGFLAAATGGGTNKVPVVCDGANWLVG